MGYKSLVQSSVKNAFKLIGDLSIPVTLTTQNSSGYNFTTKLTTLTNASSLVIKGLLIEKKQGFLKDTNELSSSRGMQFLFNAQDLDDPDIYDTITEANGNIWKVIPPYKNDGFLITLDVARSS